MSRGEDLQMLLDGELDPERARDLEERLAVDPVLQARLHELMQLEMLALSCPTRPASVEPIRKAAPPRSRRWAGWGSTVLAVAAVFVLWIQGAPTPQSATDGRVAATKPLALGPQRGVEPRFTHPLAADHRPYDVDRAGRESAGEVVSAVDLAARESQGDRRGLATLHMLAGNLASARHVLEEVEKDGAAVWSDRAALALLADDPELALRHAERALAFESGHCPARWNRALALRELGLVVSAAADFDYVARQGETGWGAEAHDRAAALRRGFQSRAERWAKGMAQGRALAERGTLPDPELVRRLPGLFRLFFYDAVRSRTSAAAVRELISLAKTLDDIHGGSVLEDYVRAVTQENFTIREPLAREYPNIDNMDEVSVGHFLARARRARQGDLLLGALFRSARWNDDPAEFHRLAVQTGDPWFLDLAQWTEIDRRLAARGAAEVALRQAVRDCAAERSRSRWRCYDFRRAFATLALSHYRLPLGLAQSRRAWGRARQEGMWEAEVPAILLVGESYRLGDEFVLAQAHLKEAALRSEGCIPRRNIVLAQAAEAAKQRQWASALQFMQGLPECDLPPPLQAAEVWSALARELGRTDAKEAFEAVVSARAAFDDVGPGDAVLVQQLRAVMELDSDRRRLDLQEVVATADRHLENRAPAENEDPNLATARSAAITQLYGDAWARGDLQEGLHWAAILRGVDLKASSCVVAVGDDGRRRMFVGRDAAGGLHRGLAVDRRHNPTVPPGFRSWLADCQVVDVLNGDGVAVSGKLLPSEIPWRYRAGATLAPNPAGPWVLVHDPEPPPILGLPRLSPWNRAEAEEDRPDRELAGSEASPMRVLQAMQTAGYVEIHAHGVVDLEHSEAAHLALSPGEDGRFALTADMVRSSRFDAAPVVVLGACEAVHASARPNGSWNLAEAFLEAGAGAVVASPAPIPDRLATNVLADLRRRIRGGATPATALRDLRATHEGDESYEWMFELVVFD